MFSSNQTLRHRLVTLLSEQQCHKFWVNYVSREKVKATTRQVNYVRQAWARRQVGVLDSRDRTSDVLYRLLANVNKFTVDNLQATRIPSFVMLTKRWSAEKTLQSQGVFDASKMSVQVRSSLKCFEIRNCSPRCQQLNKEILNWNVYPNLAKCLSYPLQMADDKFRCQTRASSDVRRRIEIVLI